ncbi:glycosyltransferase family 2 protein [Clostridium perfringens]|uniref:glycosyltransferase family 2 protein n=1 Tax=Clostridium perfringens TaxID=1502 RepID=UPI0018E4080D|nr:glycosyltransferase [Clostridium perfringens]MBI5987101.1 glycosyltransferase [Clostridium perfringens]MDK0601185.1 glycosyltransferase [Clostridium perfringens]MDK0604065.1 glycosyltransferase [Clostridium perfringens]MDM0668099.1 glycosyltransferase [Clostridium perfringens]MDM0674333.1 glycosyltransferase [Clostridium perfringens]
MKPKVSIIVPVYNCERYLEETIKSLLNQTLKDLEIIVVNDGSVDNSLYIANKFSDTDMRVRVLNQTNQGVSAARNLGLEFASGEYIGFIDGDDWIEVDMYKTLYDIAIKNNLDLVISNFEQELDGKKIVNILEIKTNLKLKKEEIINNVLPQFLKHEKLNTVCNKLFKREIIEKYKIRFLREISLGEDREFNINYFSQIESLMYINYCGYHYREVKGSATRNIFEKDYFNRALEVYNEEISSIYYKHFENKYLDELKSINFINKIISYTYIYFKSNKDIAFIQRYRYVKKMVENDCVDNCLNKYFDKIYKDKSRYEKLLLKLIKKRLVFGIYILTTYSKLRCI